MSDQIKFEGFQPNSEFVSQAHNFLWRVEESSPGGASPEAFIEKTTVGYTGKVKVVSVAGVFEAEIKSERLDQILEGLFEQLSLKLVDWKSSR